MGLSVRNFLSSGGRSSVGSGEADAFFVGWKALVWYIVGSGEVVGDEDLVVWEVEGSADDSALVRGNGNSSGGGMGRILVASSCSFDVGAMVVRCRR